MTMYDCEFESHAMAWNNIQIENTIENTAIPRLSGMAGILPAEVLPREIPAACASTAVTIGIPMP